MAYSRRYALGRMPGAAFDAAFRCYAHHLHTSRHTPAQSLLRYILYHRSLKDRKNIRKKGAGVAFFLCYAGHLRYVGMPPQIATA